MVSMSFHVGNEPHLKELLCASPRLQEEISEELAHIAKAFQGFTFQARVDKADREQDSSKYLQESTPSKHAAEMP